MADGREAGEKRRKGEGNAITRDMGRQVFPRWWFGGVGWARATCCPSGGNQIKNCGPPTIPFGKRKEDSTAAQREAREPPTAAASKHRDDVYVFNFGVGHKW